MVRSASWRIRKHQKKVVPEAVRARIEALKGSMVEQEYAVFGTMEALEDKVQGILLNAGVPSLQFPIYYSFARKLEFMKRRFGGVTLDIEVQIAYETWKARGLDATVLQDLANAVGTPVPKP